MTCKCWNHSNPFTTNSAACLLLLYFHWGTEWSWNPQVVNLSSTRLGQFILMKRQKMTQFLRICRIWWLFFLPISANLTQDRLFNYVALKQTSWSIYFTTCRSNEFIPTYCQRYVNPLFSNLIFNHVEDNCVKIFERWNPPHLPQCVNIKSF